MHAGNSELVIPAKAGTPPLPWHAMQCGSWAPAFAGVTISGRAGVSGAKMSLPFRCSRP
jgi:hypothetical protein